MLSLHPKGCKVLPLRFPFKPSYVRIKGIYSPLYSPVPCIKGGIDGTIEMILPLLFHLRIKSVISSINITFVDYGTLGTKDELCMKPKGYLKKKKALTK
jgi:hypothetical protein